MYVYIYHKPEKLLLRGSVSDVAFLLFAVGFQWIANGGFSGLSQYSSTSDTSSSPIVWICKCLSLFYKQQKRESHEESKIMATGKAKFWSTPSTSIALALDSCVALPYPGSGVWWWQQHHWWQCFVCNSASNQEGAADLLEASSRALKKKDWLTVENYLKLIQSWC